MRIAAALLALAVALPAACYLALVLHADRTLGRALSDAARAEPGRLEIGPATDGIAEARVDLEGGSALEGLCRIDPAASDDRAPLVRVLLIGGIGTGKGAARLVRPIPGAEVYAFDYPLASRLSRGNALEKAVSIPSTIKGTAESLVAFAEAKRALEERRNADGARLVLTGVSLGVPFAAALAAAGQPPDAVALLYGGAGVGPIIAEALPTGPRRVRAAAGTLLGRLLAKLDPARTVPRIAPVPFLLVNAVSDPRIPDRSVRALHDAAGEPKKVVLLGGGHVLPEKAEVLASLVEELVEWARELGFLQEVGETLPRAADGLPRSPAAPL